MPIGTKHQITDVEALYELIYSKLIEMLRRTDHIYDTTLIPPLRAYVIGVQQSEEIQNPKSIDHW